ncbi:MAG: lipid-A-disaccharide synthase [Siculibacillus sp.]|nr:lipid-A-disaccharide synthase [Siculibacillus sp.]
MNDAPTRIFIVAGETSGDHLGADLMTRLRERIGGSVEFAGVGGPEMTAAGLASLFPMTDIAVMGLWPVLERLPLILRRIHETAAAAIAARPDVLVLIDSPDFCHRVAKRVKKALPRQKIVLHVSPTVWAWRPGRARKIAAFTDRLLALLPFEPDAHRLLGGPPTTYVGHPFLEHVAGVRPAMPRTAPLDVGRRPMIVVLPGSRRSEVSRLMSSFGEALGRLAAAVGEIEVVLPAVDHVRGEIEARLSDWPVKPTIVVGRAAKFEAFARADAALAASGTVTLELAFAGLPMVAAYRLDGLGRLMKRFVDIPASLRGILPARSALLPNLVVGELAVPEFIDADCRPEALAAALAALVREGPERARQTAAFARFEARMREGLPEAPGAAAADAVVALLSAPG